MHHYHMVSGNKLPLLMEQEIMGKMY